MSVFAFSVEHLEHFQNTPNINHLDLSHRRSVNISTTLVVNYANKNQDDVSTTSAHIHIDRVPRQLAEV